MKIQDIIFWVLFVIGIIMILWFFFGKSPTIEQTLLIFILGIVIRNNSVIKENSTKLKGIISRFSALAADFKEHIKHK